MTDTLDKPQDKPQVNGKSVQEYIDELPAVAGRHGVEDRCR